MFCTQHMITIIWALLHGESWWKSSVKYLYIIMYINICKLTFARQKSTLWFKQKKSKLDIDKTFRALKVIAWSFSYHRISKQLNADNTLPVKSNWKVVRFIEIKSCSEVHIILQLNGCNQFPTSNTQLVNSAVDVKSVTNK